MKRYWEIHGKRRPFPACMLPEICMEKKLLRILRHTMKRRINALGVVVKSMTKEGASAVTNADSNLQT